MPSIPAAPIKLLLVDDDEIMRVGLRTLFERSPGIEVAGEAVSAADAVDTAARLKPDVVSMSVRLPDGSGIDACRKILAVCPGTCVMFLTAHKEEETILSALLAGARGFLLKGIGSDMLVTAVKAVAAGQSILDAEATRVIAERMRLLSGPYTASGAGDLLSEQEKRVLALVAQGKTNKEIGAALDLSDKTVKSYLHNISRKVGSRNRAQAAVMYLKQLNC